jgi:hypothetical protein
MVCRGDGRNAAATIHQELSMKNAFALALLLTFAACATTEEEPADLSDESAPAEAAPKGVETSPLPAVSPLCEPGPPSNFCYNREGRSCPVPNAISRCYIPNYCEWGILQCQGGVWVLVG